MNPSTAPATSSNRYTLVHSHHLGSPISMDLASDHITKTAQSLPIMGEAGPPFPDTNSSEQISSALASPRRSSTISPGNTCPSSFLQSKASPSGLESRAPSQERHSKLVKRVPKRARTTSQGKIARLSSEGKSNVAPLSASSMPSKDARVRSIESFVQIPTLSPIPIDMPIVFTHSQTVSTPRPRSIRHGSHSIYEAPPNVVMELSEPSLPLVTSIASGIEKNAELDLFPSAGGPVVYTHRTISDTTRTGDETIAKHKRGISFDFMSLKPFISSPTSPSSPVNQGMKRRRSLRKTQHMSETKISLEKWAEPLSERPLSERQRVLNVKRARKMAQVFGSEPPSGLYQITNLDHTVINDSDESISLADERNTISPDPLSSSISITSSRPPSASSCIDAANSHENGQTVNPQSVRPPTPPPFMSPANSDPHLTGSSLAFKLRRRRAAKLSNFFGVGYHDISASMSSTILPSPPPPSSRHEPSESQLRSSGTGTRTQPTSIEVDIKMSGRTGRWGIVDGRRSMRDADMGDVISKLREMKAK